MWMELCGVPIECDRYHNVSDKESGHATKMGDVRRRGGMFGVVTAAALRYGRKMTSVVDAP